MYPYERGVEMLRVIRKLGGPKDASGASSARTFMDQFRLLITEIGNALVCLRTTEVRGVEASLEVEAMRAWRGVDSIGQCVPRSHT